MFLRIHLLTVHAPEITDDFYYVLNLHNLSFELKLNHLVLFKNPRFPRLKHNIRKYFAMICYSMIICFKQFILFQPLNIKAIFVNIRYKRIHYMLSNILWNEIIFIVYSLSYLALKPVLACYEHIDSITNTKMFQRA